MICQACGDGDHDNCNMATWCQCDCEGYQDGGSPTFSPYADDYDTGGAPDPEPEARP